MTVAAAFLAHETVTQLRSLRFRALAAAYIAICSAPAIALAVTRARMETAVGPAAYAEALMMLQPLVTTLLAAVIAVDGVTRERDEGSLPVVALAPLSNSAYLLARWLSIAILLIVLTLIPCAIALGLASTGDLPPSPASFLGPWLLRVLPLALAVSAFALGIGTISGGLLQAAGATFLLVVAGFGFGNDILARSKRVLTFPAEFLFGDFASVRAIEWAIRGYISPNWSTDAPFDLAGEFHRDAAPLALTLGLGAVALGMAAAYVRRSRPDVRPWRIRDDHPLRTYLRGLNRLREELTPDPSMAPRDGFVIALGCAALAAAIAYGAIRHDRYFALARERFEAETSGAPLPTPAAVVPLRWSVNGTVEASGRVRTIAEITFRNDGVRPERHLAFTLNEALAATWLTGDPRCPRWSGSTACRAAGVLTRKWDRLAVDLADPVAPGGTRSLRFEIVGAPSTFSFPLREPLSERFAKMVASPHAFDLRDFSLAASQRHVSDRSVELSGSALAPVPRYTTWVMSKREGINIPPRVPQEVTLRTCDVQVALRVPPGRQIVDACGSASESGMLRSRCAADPNQYVLAGGRLRRMPVGNDISLFVFPAHQSLAEEKALLLERAVVTARESWPGMAFPRHTSFVELPPAGHDDWPWWSVEDLARVRGAMVLIPEGLMTARRQIRIEQIAAAMISARLMQSAQTAPQESAFFFHFFVAMARKRMGGEQATAVTRSGFPDREPVLPRANGYRPRMAHMIADLTHRAGSDRLVAGINDFLAAHRDRPGTAEAMFEAIGRRAGISLSRFYADFVRGDALPNLTMRDVRFTRRGTEWHVAGRLANVGTGEVFPSVVLRTDGGSQSIVLPIDSGQERPFAFTTADQPRSVELDPLRAVYRHEPVGTISTVEYRGDRR